MAAQAIASSSQLTSTETLRELVPGMVCYLPPRHQIASTLHIDPDLSSSDFDHPVMILRLRIAEAEEEQTCDIAIVSSLLRAVLFFPVYTSQSDTS
jgi:hypothetical protein